MTGADVLASHLPFSPADGAGDLVFVSGQASVDRGGIYVEDDFAGEVACPMANIECLLAATDGTMDDIVQGRSYLGDAGNREEYNARHPQYFSAPLPARTTVSGGIGSLEFELDVVADLLRGSERCR